MTSGFQRAILPAVALFALGTAAAPAPLVARLAAEAAAAASPGPPPAIDVAPVSLAPDAAFAPLAVAAIFLAPAATAEPLAAAPVSLAPDPVPASPSSPFSPSISVSIPASRSLNLEPCTSFGLTANSAFRIQHSALILDAPRLTRKTSRGALHPSPPLRFPSRNLFLAGRARLVRDSLADGSLDPRAPLVREALAPLVESDPDGAAATLGLVLATFPGASERNRVKSALSWAAEHEGGRYYGAFFYAAARRAYERGEYAEAAAMARETALGNPSVAPRSRLLEALSFASLGEYVRAQELLAEIKARHPGTYAAREAPFAEAWIALSLGLRDEAAAILEDVVATGTRAAISRANALLQNIRATEEMTE